jgi:molybdenum cofactor synthesis domain-containing protein
MFKVGIITASDKGAAGLRVDESGKVVREMVTAYGFSVTNYRLVADDRSLLARTMMELADDEDLDLILTTGGTGFSPRDWTPEATLDVIHRQAPGIAEAMRAHSMKITPKAMLSRGIAGIRNQCLIINLPGSPKAVRENLECILPALPHGLAILTGQSGECGQA